MMTAACVPTARCCVQDTKAVLGHLVLPKTPAKTNVEVTLELVRPAAAAKPVFKRITHITARLKGGRGPRVKFIPDDTQEGTSEPNFQPNFVIIDGDE